MKILVTGGAGFIGSAVVRLAVARGHEVVNLDALTYAACLDNVASVAGSNLYTFVQADICDHGAVTEACCNLHSPDAILHLAAESHVDRSIDGPGAFIQTNVTGTYTLLDAARGYWEGRGRPETASGFTMSRPMRSMAPWGTQGFSPKTHPMRRTRPTRPPRRPRITWCAPGTRPMACRSYLTNCSNNYGPVPLPRKTHSRSYPQGVGR